MRLNCGVGEDSWESLGLQGDQANQSSRKSVLNIHWKDWCWSWSSNTLTTWCKELTHWKRPWCWERLKAGGEGDDRGWDGWMASATQWTCVWASSESWWWTGKPGMLQSMGLQRVRHNWVTELNWSSNTIIKATCLRHLQLWAKLLPAPLGSSVKWKKSPLWRVQYGTFYLRDSLSENSLVNLNGRDRNSLREFLTFWNLPHRPNLFQFKVFLSLAQHLFHSGP